MGVIRPTSKRKPAARVHADKRAARKKDASAKAPATAPPSSPPVQVVPAQPVFDPWSAANRGDSPPAESPELAALINYIRDGRCVLFVGAGLSRSAGLPSWQQLMEQLIQTIADRGDEKLNVEELKGLLAQRKYPELAGHCRELLGWREFYKAVIDALTRKQDVPAFYKSIVSTPFACIVTTNFDTLLEDAFAQWDLHGIPKTPTGADLAQQGTLLLDGAFFVLKAHGDVGDPQSMIFTADDYRRVIHANPAFQSILSSILLSRAVLFVGYSLNDPNFRLLLDSQLTIFNEEVPPRYAVMTGVGKVEQDILWRTARIRVLPYADGQHEEVGRFLDTIAARAGRRLGQPSEATVPAEPAAADPAPRRTLGRPRTLSAATLAIRGRADRFDVDLTAQKNGGTELLFSGVSRRPSISGIQERLPQSVHGWTLGDVSRIGPFLLHDEVAGLERSLGELPEDTVIELACSAEAEVLPWEWLVVEGMPLCLRYPVARRSVVLSHKARGLRYVGQPLRALVIGATEVGGTFLPGAKDEAERVKAVIENQSAGAVVTLLLAKDASYERVIREVEMGDYDIIHFAGIAGVDDNESYLTMNDGFVRNSELVSLLNRRPPAFMMFNSDLTAFVPPINGFSRDITTSSSAEWPLHLNPRGFSRLAARAGVGAFIGVFRNSLPDDAAARMATEVYTALLNGFPVAQALLQARKRCVQFEEVNGCFYTLNGHPHLCLGNGTR